jgi:hypothetical protein
MNAVKSAARTVAAMLFGLLAASCAAPEAAMEWEPAAARAVVRHVQEQNPGTRVAVLGTEGAGGAELPWGVRQSLTTGGVEVVSRDPASPGMALLVLDRSARSNGDWLVDTTYHPDPAGGARPDRARWRVSCRAEQCTVSSAS